MTKTIDTLVDDIYKVFTEDHEISPENLELFSGGVVDAVKRAVAEANIPRDNYLRMSNLGKPDRQLWYELKHGKQADLPPHKHIMFLYGYLVEELIMFLIRESGHTLGHVQHELEVGGIVGHTDGTVDRVPMDIKSASGYSWRTKFLHRGLLKPEGDPFGYKGQLSGYREALMKEYPDDIDKDVIAWIAMNKETGEICVLKADMFDMVNAEEKIKTVQKNLELDIPPAEKCYTPTKAGTGGNKELPKSCYYCPFKFDCWKDSNGGRGLRGFQYAGGVKYLVDVAKIPKVPEVTFNG